MEKEYTDIPALARKGLITAAQYELQKKYANHETIEALTLYRFKLKLKKRDINA